MWKTDWEIQYETPLNMQTGHGSYRNRQFAPAPLYRFGDGRSFSRFRYSSARLSPAAPGVCDSVTLHVDVKNEGSEAAEEVVQVYSRCPCSAALCQAGRPAPAFTQATARGASLWSRSIALAWDCA